MHPNRHHHQHRNRGGHNRDADANDGGGVAVALALAIGGHQPPVYTPRPRSTFASAADASAAPSSSLSHTMFEDDVM